MKDDYSLKPNLSLPGELAIGMASPVQKTHNLLRRFFETQPSPDIVGAVTQRTALLSANHLLVLIEACGILNGSGKHSAAVILLRSLEDALDVFSAVATIPEAAERWEKGKLKPSDAAKLWVEHQGNPTVSTGQSLADYRKNLRCEFNKYSHASYELCLWNLYFNPAQVNVDGRGTTGTLEINHARRVINSNAHSLDAHLTAHLLEFLTAIKTAYATTLKHFDGADDLVKLEAEIQILMEKHNLHGCQNVQTPAELRHLR